MYLSPLSFNAVTAIYHRHLFGNTRYFGSRVHHLEKKTKESMPWLVLHQLIKAIQYLISVHESTGCLFFLMTARKTAPEEVLTTAAVLITK